jgi:hypothetical protein
MKDGFLARWSRRKLEEREPAAGQRPVGQDVAENGDATALEHIPADTPDDVITPEELAALPPIAEITLDTDITAFLRRGVPSILRNAALQRLWVLDPAIRDFVGEARDYAWDWNTPGGVPVSGPLEPGTDIPAMLRRIFGEEPAPERENVIANSKPVPASPAPQRPAPAKPTIPKDAVAPAEYSIVSVKDETSENDAPIRRHGSALPT